MAHIVWIRQLSVRVQDMCTTVDTLLADLQATSRFMEDTLDFVDELRAAEKEKVRAPTNTEGLLWL